MEWVEITAKTVDEAKERALDELGIDHDEAEFVVLEEPRRGLFGQTRGTARVRARVTPRTPPAKTDRRSRRGRQSSAERDESAEKGTSRSTKRGSSKSSGAAAKDERPRKSATPRSTQSSTTSTRPDRKAGSKGSGSPTKAAKQEGTTMTMTLDEQISATEEFLTGLLDAIGFDARVTTERTDDANASVNIEGDDLGLLIGPRGQTMNAIQDLARIVLQKQAAGSWEGHVHVDVNGYRAKRRAALVAFVEKVAADVVESGTAKALEPMSSSDRKLVHDTVNGIDGVRTSSEGHEPRRWVMISPDDA